jgi:hypothetical protein
MRERRYLEAGVRWTLGRRYLARRLLVLWLARQGDACHVRGRHSVCTAVPHAWERHHAPFAPFASRAGTCEPLWHLEGTPVQAPANGQQPASCTATEPKGDASGKRSFEVASAAASSLRTEPQSASPGAQPRAGVSPGSANATAAHQRSRENRGRPHGGPPGPIARAICASYCHPAGPYTYKNSKPGVQWAVQRGLSHRSVSTARHPAARPPRPQHAFHSRRPAAGSHSDWLASPSPPRRAWQPSTASPSTARPSTAQHGHLNTTLHARFFQASTLCMVV